MRPLSALPTVVLTALLLSACQATPPAVTPAAPAARTASVRVTPTVQAGGVRELAAGRGLFATKTAYTQASINHMVVELFSVAGAVETPIITTDLSAAQLGNTVTFGNLAHDTTYRIRAYAYKAAGLAAGDKISDDASSDVDVVVTNDDAPALGNLVVSLIDQTFAGSATSDGLTVNAGTLVHAGGISITAFLPIAFNDVSTFAGSGQGYENANGTAADFDSPTDAAVDAAGNVYVADRGNLRIRKIEPDGDVSDFAGSGFAASIDGTGTGAAFSDLIALAIDPAGNLYAIDARCIRKITPGGLVSTLAGDNGQPAAVVDDLGGDARFYGPDGIAVAPDGDIWVTDKAAHKIRKVSPAGAVTTIAGNGPHGGAPNNFTDGSGAGASFAYPAGIAVDRAGNAFVADSGNHRIRKVTPAGDVTTFAGSGVATSANGQGAAAAFDTPLGLAFDRAGHLLVTHTGVVRRVSPLAVASVVAGAYGVTGSTDGFHVAASFNGLAGVASAPDGNAYVVDSGNHRIRKLSMLPL